MRRALLLTALLGLGCSGELSSNGRPPDGGPSDGGMAAQRDASSDARVPMHDGGPGSDAATGPDAGPPPPTFSHVRELRGAWVASVFNLTWPSRTGLSESASRAEIVSILETMRALHMNAVFVQVRAESDAFYRSSLEPWSRFLTGTQGTDPGWDPLAVWIEEGHARGIEVHAWINPYRGMTNSSVSRASNHVTRTLSQYAVPWGNLIVMDPGAPEVRAHIVAVVRDIVTRYDVDGIHFDDYFYPYPGGGPSEFPDDATYAAYGGDLSRGDWRRENVNTLIREVHEAILAEREDVRFGISPFGIYRPGMPPGISGLDAYATLYADAPRWIAEGWVDYLAPQLYWASDQAAQAFGPLIEWWSERPRDPARSMLSGMNLTNLSEKGWPASEIRTQIELTRGQREKGARGYILYRADQLVSDLKGMRSLFTELNAQPAATPTLATAAGARIDRPDVEMAGSTLTFTPPPGVQVRAYAIYDAASGSLVELVHRTSVSLGAGSYAVTAIDRRGVESAAVLVELP